MKDVLDAVCFHSPSLSTHCIIITGRSLSLSMPMAGLRCSYMPWVQTWSAQVMWTLQLMYTSCLVSAWATKSSFPMLYTLWINSAQKLCSHTWIVFCQGLNIMQSLCLFRKVCMFMPSLIIIVSIIFLSSWSTTFPKSSSSTSWAWCYPWVNYMWMLLFRTRGWMSYWDKWWQGLRWQGEICPQCSNKPDDKLCVSVLSIFCSNTPSLM